jgi:hypothetical protein
MKDYFSSGDLCEEEYYRSSLLSEGTWDFQNQKGLVGVYDWRVQVRPLVAGSSWRPSRNGLKVPGRPTWHPLLTTLTSIHVSVYRIPVTPRRKSTSPNSISAFEPD